MLEFFCENELVLVRPQLSQTLDGLIYYCANCILFRTTERVVKSDNLTGAGVEILMS